VLTALLIPVPVGGVSTRPTGARPAVTGGIYGRHGYHIQGGRVTESERRATSHGRRQADFQREQELAMLRAEIELLMVERDQLLRSTGAAAIFVAKLDSQVLPESAYEAADILAATINGLPEETLQDAIELVRKQLGETLGEGEQR
jgi:hypothetical protein